MTEKTEKRLCFFGSRTLKGKATEDLIISEIEKHQPTVIVTSGEVDGVCAVARRLSRRFAVPLKVYWLDFRKHGRGAWEWRSKDILNDSDYVVFIHDGRSVGTANEKKLADKMKKPSTYHKLEKEKGTLGKTEMNIEDLEVGRLSFD